MGLVRWIIFWLFVGFVGFGVLSCGACVGVGSLLANKAETALNQRWVETLPEFREIERRYPLQQVNKTALALEILGAEMGLELATKTTEGRIRPSDERKAGFKVISEDLGDYVDSVGRAKSLDLVPIPNSVRIFLNEFRQTLDGMCDLLSTSPPPAWERDISRGIWGPLPYLLGQIHLQRLLVAKYLDDVAGQSPENTEHILEASRILNSNLWLRPELVSRLVGMAVANMEAAALRANSEVDPKWADRISDRDYRSSLLECVGVDQWLFAETVRSRKLFGEDRAGIRFWLFDYLSNPLARFEIFKGSEVTRRGVSDLQHKSFDGFNADLEFEMAKEHASSAGGREPYTVPPIWNYWDRANRLMLSLELTSEVIRYRQNPETASDLIIDGPGIITPSKSVPGISWRHQRVDGGIRVSVVSNLAPASENLEGSMTLEYLVGLAD